MTDEEAWFRGLAAAAFQLQIELLNGLQIRGILTNPDVNEIIDAALLRLETRDGALPEKDRRVNETARTHLGRVRTS